MSTPIPPAAEDAREIPAPPVLQVEEVCKQYRYRPTISDRLRNRAPKTITAVDRVSFKAAPGEVLGLMGESGCGKTTLGKCICRLAGISSGRILLEGRDITSISGAELRERRRRFQMLFQNPYSTLNPMMQVEDALKETLRVNFRLKSGEERDRISEVLERVGLTAKLKAYPTELSGGERRRVGLARLLLLDPVLIVADEPVAGLDASIKARIVDLMLEVRRPEMAYVFISHDLNVVRYVSDRTLIMHLGRLVEEVPTSRMGQDVHHPYTWSLLGAAEEVRVRRGGSHRDVDFRDLPSHGEIAGGGCPYLSRCELPEDDPIRERCLQDEPQPRVVGEGHWIACHRFESGEVS